MARSYHHGDLRQAFLREAAQIVEIDGVEALTLRELARRVGVSHAASTNHFADKGSLLAELAADGFTALSSRLAAAPKSRSAAAHLRETGRAYVQFAREQPGHFRVMFGRTGQLRSPRLTDASAAAYRLLEDAVRAALPPNRSKSALQVSQAAFTAWSVAHGAAMLILDGALPSTVPKEALDGMVNKSLGSISEMLSG